MSIDFPNPQEKFVHKKKMRGTVCCISNEGPEKPNTIIQPADPHTYARESTVPSL